MSRIEIERFVDLEQLSTAAAEQISRAIIDGVRSRGMASLVLAGGKTPEMTYRKLAADPEIPWERVHLFWGDERWLPPDDPDSNFSMVKNALLDKIPLPQQNLHAIDHGAVSPQEAALLYDDELRAFLDAGQRPDGKAQFFDLTLLGMGEDGHTASLFPGHSLLHEKSRYAAAVPNPAGKPFVPRVTMTFVALACSRRILFLIKGAKKEKILRQLERGGNCQEYPAAQVRAVEEVRWLVAADPADAAKGGTDAP